LYQLNAAPSSGEAALTQHEEKSVSEAYYDEALPDNKAGHQPHTEAGSTGAVNLMARIRTSRINYQGLNNFKEQTQEDIKGLPLHKQKMSTDRLNKHRNRPTQYNQGDIVYVSNKQIKSKNKNRFEPEEVEGNGRVTVKTKSGKIFPKSHIKS